MMMLTASDLGTIAWVMKSLKAARSTAPRSIAPGITALLYTLQYIVKVLYCLLCRFLLQRCTLLSYIA